MAKAFSTVISNQNVNINHLDSKDDLYDIMDSITKTCSKSYFNKILKSLCAKNRDNANIICDYIVAEQTQFNIKDSSKEGKIKTLVWLSNFFQDELSFKDMSTEQILSFLNKGRKALEDDKAERWIGTYNNRQMILLKFFKWLHNPNQTDSKKRKTPKCMHGIRQLPRKDKICYNPTDMWYPRESSIFLKYCPSKRDSCYHALAIDTACRPHELLNLKISSVLYKTTDSGKQYAEVVIKGGKSRTRTVPLIDSLPFLKTWILAHPTGNNPDSWLFVSNANTNFGSKLTYDGLSYRYKYFYRLRYFPKLLDDETVSDEDKSVIRSMLIKPWNLYVYRHSSLTEKSKYLKEHVLRSLAGWTPSSKIAQVYIHYLGNESVNSLLEIKGLKSADASQKTTLLKYCTNCNEANSPFQRFCMKCKMIMSYDAYKETVEEQKKKESEIQVLREGFNKEMIKLKEQITKDVKKEVTEFSY